MKTEEQLQQRCICIKIGQGCLPRKVLFCTGPVDSSSLKRYKMLLVQMQDKQKQKNMQLYLYIPHIYRYFHTWHITIDGIRT